MGHTMSPRQRDARSSRRRFLKVTGAGLLTSTVAGCSGSRTGNGSEGGGKKTTAADGSTSGTPGGSSDLSLDKYPYRINETAVGKAKQVMEEAGYGPNNKFELNWLQYKSPTWKEMASTIQARLNSAHVKMNINSADFGALLKKTEQGKHEAFTLGWIADYPEPKNFIQLLDPPNTVYDDPKTKPNGARLFFSEDAKASGDVRQFMVDQFDRMQNNPESNEEAQQIRNDAAVKIEEGMWESACMIPVYHSLSEVFWYDNVEYNPYGGMGYSRAKTNASVTSVTGGDRVGLWRETFNTLDPIASGNTESGDVLMDIFDAPMNYVNGTTEVKGLLVSDYTTNDDLTKYTFTLKEGVQFHGDYGEVTAADVEYSIRRLVESENSTNTYFPISVMGIKHETDDDDNIVPGSTGVKATGDYEFTVELEKPFAYALPVLAYGAFSIVPEGIVGDIEGYEGEMDYQTFATSSPIGAGPFEFVKWESGNGGEVAVETFEDYHGTVPSYKTVHRAILSDTSAQYNYFLNHNADISEIPTSKYDPEKVSVEETIEGGRQIGTYGPMKNDETVNYAGVPTIDTYYIGFNMEKVPEAVRKAMAYVINHEQFVKSVFKGRGEPAFHLQPPQVFPGGAEAYDKHYQG